MEVALSSAVARRARRPRCGRPLRCVQVGLALVLMEEEQVDISAQLAKKRLSKRPNPPAIVGLSHRKAEKLDQSLQPGEWVLVLLSYLVLILTFPVSVWMCLQIVKEYEQVVILRLGHMRKGAEVRPGVYFILPCIDILIRVDTRTRFLHLSIKEVLTKDPLSLDITGAVYYRIQDPLLLLRNVTDPDEATVLLMQTTLGDVLGTKYLSQIICNREKISENIQSEHPVAKSGGSPASSGGSTPPPCPELKEKEGQVEPPQTVKESSEMPTTLDSVQKETTGDVVHESPNPCAENPLQNGKELKEGPSPPD
ncbi:stomatin-like isoform X2 [Anolis carolinensis]|uniref:stomatin-like isoform X2 n=1 Tax=Anolis carolinensis TaxID=28377 RepID=UPI002F2B5E74